MLNLEINNFLSKSRGGTILGDTYYNKTVAQITAGTGEMIANKVYVDAKIAGLDSAKQHPSVACMAVVNIAAIAGGFVNIDGVLGTPGMRILLNNQTLVSTNGIYIASTGAWTRALDMDTDAEAAVDEWTIVSAGTIYGNVGVRISTGVDGTTTHIDSNVITFSPFTGTIGNYLYKPGNAGGQVACGGNADQESLILKGTSNVNEGGSVSIGGRKNATTGWFQQVFVSSGTYCGCLSLKNQSHHNSFHIRNDNGGTTGLTNGWGAYIETQDRGVYIYNENPTYTCSALYVTAPNARSGRLVDIRASRSFGDLIYIDNDLSREGISVNNFGRALHINIAGYNGDNAFPGNYSNEGGLHGMGLSVLHSCCGNSGVSGETHSCTSLFIRDTVNHFQSSSTVIATMINLDMTTGSAWTTSTSIAHGININHNVSAGTCIVVNVDTLSSANLLSLQNSGVVSFSVSTGGVISTNSSGAVLTGITANITCNTVTFHVVNGLITSVV